MSDIQSEKQAKFKSAKQELEKAIVQDKAEREVLKKQLVDAGRPIKVGNGDIKLPEGKIELEAPFYGYDTKYNADGDVVEIWHDGIKLDKQLMDVPSQYDEMNSLETFIKSFNSPGGFNGELSSFMDENANIVYLFSSIYPDTFEPYLNEHGIPFAKQIVHGVPGAYTYIISEEKLAQRFPEQAKRRSPVVDFIVNKAGPMYTDRLGDKQEFALALSGAIDRNKILINAERVFNDFVDIISDDQYGKARDLLKFERLTEDKKFRFAKSLIEEYATRKGIPKPTIVVDNTMPAVGSFDHVDNVIKLNLSEAKDATKFAGTIAHEFAGHAADHAGVGVLNPRQIELSDALSGLSQGGVLADEKYEKLYQELKEKLDNEIPLTQAEKDAFLQAGDEYKKARAAYWAHLTEINAYEISKLFDKKSEDGGFINAVIDAVKNKSIRTAKSFKNDR